MKRLVDAVETTLRLTECRDTLARFIGDRWPAKSAEWQQVIRAVMWHRGIGAVEAVLFLANTPNAPNEILLAALCDLLEGKRAEAEVRQ